MNPYFAVLRTNRNFRLYWGGQIVSQLGDWFNVITVQVLGLSRESYGFFNKWPEFLCFWDGRYNVIFFRIDQRRRKIAKH